MDNIINNIYDEPDEIVKPISSIDSPSGLSTENDYGSVSEGIDTSWIQESERYHHISDNQERELMNSIGFYFIYINKHDYIEKILFEKGVLENDPANGFSFLSKETILKIIQNKKISTPTSKYKLIDILSFVVDIEPNKVKEFLEMDTFDSDLEKIFLKVLPIFNDIHIDKSIFVFHSINHLYFIFQEVQHSSNHRTTLKSILKHNKSKEGSDNQSHPVTKSPSSSADNPRRGLSKDDLGFEPPVGFSKPSEQLSCPESEPEKNPIKEREPDQRAESLLTTNLVGDLWSPVMDRRSQPCSPIGAAEDKFDKPTNKGTKKVRIVDNIRELRKLSNKGRFTRKVF